MPAVWHPTHDDYAIYLKLSDPLDAKVHVLPIFDQFWQWRDSKPHIIHLLVDAIEMRQVPANWLVLRGSPVFKHPRAGEIVIVGIAPGFHILLDTLMRIVRFKRVKLFSTMREGEEYLNALVERTKAEYEAASGNLAQ